MNTDGADFELIPYAGNILVLATSVTEASFDLGTQTAEAPAVVGASGQNLGLLWRGRVVAIQAQTADLLVSFSASSTDVVVGQATNSPPTTKGAILIPAGTTRKFLIPGGRQGAGAVGVTDPGLFLHYAATTGTGTLRAWPCGLKICN